MPTISQKGQLMPESPIRKLVPFAEKAKSKGTKVYHLNIGQPDIPSPKVAIEAVKNINLNVLEYSHSAGFLSYREKLAQMYQNIGLQVNSDDIIVTTGGSEALLFAMGSILDSDDEIIIPEPFYANYNGFATASNVKVVPVISSIDDNFGLPPIADFEKLITPKTKAILICNPGNPSGYLYSKEEMQQLADLVIKHDLFLLADEVYREFIYDSNSQHYSVLSFEAIQNHAIMIDSVSKRYSMCGARIGCVVSKNKEVIATVLKFAQARLSPPTLAQIASEAALDTPKSYFEEVNNTYKERRDILVQELQKIDGVKVANPKGAFYCIAELPINDADKFAQWLLESFEFEGHTTMLAPAAGFYSSPNVGNNQVRIAYVLDKDDLIHAIKILGEALKVYRD